MVSSTGRFFNDEVRSLTGICLSCAALSTLIPLASVVMKLAITILLNPRTNITVINTFAFIGSCYLAYEIINFSKIIIMKALSIIFGPNEYTHRSFHGYKFEWLQPEIPHPDPIIDVYVNPQEDVFVSYRYPMSDIEAKLYRAVEDLEKQGCKIEEV